MRFIAQWCLLSILLVMIVKPVQAQQGKGLTRSDIENNRYAGFLFTDIKGVRLQFNGFVQGDFMFDFNDIANRTGFQPSTITVPQLKEANTAFSIRQSRFAFTAYGEPDSKGRHLEAHLEFDFASPNNTTGLRLRHAYMKHGKWLFGHTWTNFMDASIWPNIMDAWGPNGYVLLRQVQMRFTQKINEHQSVSFSLEQPGSDVKMPDSSWKARTVYPDVTAAYQYDFGRSHLRLSGLLHPIAYKNTVDGNETKIGGGFNFSGDLSVSKNDDIKFQFAYGSGYARYSEGIGGQGYDGYFKNNVFNTVDLVSTWLFLDHYWNTKYSTTLGWGYLQTNGNADMGASAFRHSHYGCVDMTYYFTDFFKIAAEVLYGQRQNVDKASANDVRLQFSTFFKF